MSSPIAPLLAVLCVAAPAAGQAAAAAAEAAHWVGSWAASQQVPEPENALPATDMTDATLRQVVHLSLGGRELRVRFSNVFGTAPLHIAAAHIARPQGAGAIDPASDTALTFSGAPDATIPAGADYLSDPVAFNAAALSDLAITIYLDQAPAGETSHPGSHSTTCIVHGNRVSAASFAEPESVDHWFEISGVDVEAPAAARAIVVLGDSITDGHAATTNANERWPDELARDLQANAPTHEVAVVNEGTGGNHLLTDGLGPNALARFDRDVLAQAGVRYVIVLEGINDLGALGREAEVSPASRELLVHRMTAAYEQLIARAHAHGIKIYGATIMPDDGSDYYHPGALDDAEREALNDWIRAPGHFDAVIDFDRITRDPAAPGRLLAADDSGDHLHPGPQGYAAMGDAVPLSLFGAPAARPPKSHDEGPQIAFTFDDLPAHATLPPGETRVEIARKVITALEAARMPPIYGFVNGLRLEQEPASAPVLDLWRKAGFPLGNHTWSHMNLNASSAQAWEADTLRNEPLLEQLMPNGGFRWLRFPYLAEGDTPAKQAQTRSFLAARGYAIADVTMSFADYEFNDPYARCVAKGDGRAIADLKSMYVASARASIPYYRDLSHRLYGRDIRYVLLMHIGALDAELLPQLIDIYRQSGFRFVTLQEAEKDPFYRTETDLKLPAVTDDLEGQIAAHGMPLPKRTDYQPTLDAMCK